MPIDLLKYADKYVDIKFDGQMGCGKIEETDGRFYLTDGIISRGAFYLENYLSRKKDPESKRKENETFEITADHVVAIRDISDEIEAISSDKEN